MTRARPSRIVPHVSGLIGTSVARRDAPAKVTGAARYTDDLVVEGAWFGLTVRSTEPHARLLGIDRDPAFDWSRVVVVTAADIPGENVVHLMKDDQPVLVADEIRHHAEPVALVAAPDPATARAARAAIRLRTEPLPAGARPARVREGLRPLRDREGRPRGRASPRPTWSSKGTTGSAPRSTSTSSRRR